jgi:hypothetical protein
MPHYVVVLLYGSVGVSILLLVLRLGNPLLAVIYTAPVPPPVPGTTKIACVGDSITYGYRVKSRRENCYPAELEKLLGKKFSVRILVQMDVRCRRPPICRIGSTSISS